MRKFSPKRLYHLSKILVIIVSVIYALNAVLSWSCAYGPISRKYIGEGLTYTVLTCQHDTNKGASIAIGLPILFFGGTALFKYLFPVKEKLKDKKR